MSGMSMTPTERPSVPLRESIAEEIRVHMTRQRVTGVALAARIGRSQSYVSRRLTGETAFDLDDLERIAYALSVTVFQLMPRPAANAGLPQSTNATRPSSPDSVTGLARNRRPGGANRPPNVPAHTVRPTILRGFSAA